MAPLALALIAAFLLLPGGEAMATVEKPIDSAHVWLVNATEEPVDVYVNYRDQPALTDLHGLEIGPQLEVKGRDGTPYGVYTFSFRPKDQPTAEVLASASVDVSVGSSFTAALHQLPDRSHRVSIYENYFTPPTAGESGRNHGVVGTRRRAGTRRDYSPCRPDLAARALRDRAR